jgi:hypothetical protein
MKDGKALIRKLHEQEDLSGTYEVDLDGIGSIINRIKTQEGILEIFNYVCKYIDEKEE